MTFKTLKEANKRLQELGRRPGEIARIFKGFTFIHEDGDIFTLDGGVTSSGRATDYSSGLWEFAVIEWYTVTALPDQAKAHTREQIQDRINEIIMDQKERIEKGRSESNEKKRLQRQLDALPRFIKGAVYRLENPKADEVHIGVCMGIDSDGDHTFLNKIVDYGIPMLSRLQVMPQHVEHYSIIDKLADQDDCNLQWLLDGKWDEMETTR